MKKASSSSQSTPGISHQIPSFSWPRTLYSIASSLLFRVHCSFRAICLHLFCSTQGVPSHLILGALVLGFLPPLFRGIITTDWWTSSFSGWTTCRLCWSFWDQDDRVVSVSPRMPFSPFFSVTEFRTPKFASTMHCEQICTFSVQFLCGDSKNSPCWAGGRHICEAGHLTSWRSLCHHQRWCRQHIPPSPHQGDQPGPTWPFISHKMFLACTHHPLQWTFGSWWLGKKCWASLCSHLEAAAKGSTNSAPIIHSNS